MQHDRLRIEINDRLAHTILASAARHSDELATGARCIVGTMAAGAVVELFDQVLVFTFNTEPPVQARFATKDTMTSEKAFARSTE